MRHKAALDVFYERQEARLRDRLSQREWPWLAQPVAPRFYLPDYDVEVRK